MTITTNTVPALNARARYTCESGVRKKTPDRIASRPAKRRATITLTPAVGPTPRCHRPGALWSVAGPLGFLVRMNIRAAVAVLCAAPALVCTCGAAAADGGSGTYVATGTTYYFDFLNSGTAAWQLFTVVGPPGMTFIVGTSANEQSARCVVGQPDGQANEIECGPLSLNVAPAHTHLSFVATSSAPVACGALFQLAVSSTGVPPFTSAPDVTEAGPCVVASRTATVPPTLHGKPVVGRTITATPPSWSNTPTRVAYRWQRCNATRCMPLPGANTLRFALTRADAGRTVRLVATALIDGAAVVSASERLAVQAR